MKPKIIGGWAISFLGLHSWPIRGVKYLDQTKPVGESELFQVWRWVRLWRDECRWVEQWHLGETWKNTSLFISGRSFNVLWKLFCLLMSSHPGFVPRGNLSKWRDCFQWGLWWQGGKQCWYANICIRNMVLGGKTPFLTDETHHMGFAMLPLDTAQKEAEV